MRVTRHDYRGYILLEVVASLAILVFGILYLGRAISTSLRANHVASDYTMATLLAQYRLYEVEITAETNPDDLRSEKGDFDELGDEFSLFTWEQTVRKVDDMFGVTVAVSFERYSQDYSVRLGSAIYPGK